jgi:mono/diheme cytochrome c family protein
MIQNQSWTIVVLAATVASMLSACGGEEAAGPCGEEPVAQTADAAPSAEAKATPTASGESCEAIQGDAFIEHGKRIFMSKGSNTCNDCHGPDGKKGRLEQAANLTDPSSWNSTKALGGDQAKVDAAIMYLVSNGGKKFNESYVKDHPDAGWDWSKTESTSYDIQMFGVTQSSTMSELKKIRKDLKKAGIDMPKDDLTEFGATAVLRYVRSLSAAPAAE